MLNTWGIRVGLFFFFNWAALNWAFLFNWGALNWGNLGADFLFGVLCFLAGVLCFFSVF